MGSKIKKFINKLKKVNIEYINKTKYLKYYNKNVVKENYIFLDSQHGSNINGNIFYIAKELSFNEKYDNYKLFMSVTKAKYETFKNFLENKNMTNINLVIIGSRRYYKLLSTCKYLFNDTSFLPFFIKKEDQVYVNVWHGTPLKHLGRSMNEGYHAIGNVQRNFIQSDYLLYPNEYMKEHMIKDYMLENICSAKVLMLGYPRNTIFFDKNNKQKIKEKLNLTNKQVICYMPTYRDDMSRAKEAEYVSKLLKRIDKKLNDNQIMYVNLHPFVGDRIEYNFKHIYKFPKEYETYEFLSASDLLITDYSSVFYDYAVSKNKIILFNYDEKKYFANRGCYMSFNDLPFPKVSNVNELIEEINNNKYTVPDKFLKTFCKYDSIDVTQKLCERVILNKVGIIKEDNIKNNKKKNILIYTGSLAKNGLTSSLLNLCNYIDKDKYNIYLTFNTRMVKPHAKTIRLFPDGINYIPVDGKANASIFEKILILLFYRTKMAKFALKTVNKINKYEIKREFHNVKFDTVIQFGGYDSKKIMLFSCFDCNRVIYVHSDMTKEINTRGNQKKHILDYAYNEYDKIAVVTDSLIKPTQEFVKDKNKINVVENVIDNISIKERSLEKLVFDKDTACNVDIKELKKILNSKKAIKFITVGRFSPEKGHERLIRAFNKIYSKNKNTYLIIIGGHGILYSKTLELVKSLRCRKNVIIIKSMINPFPVVAKCDCFILPSFYEGFGLVLVEADILGLKTFSVNIDGPKKFILNNNGNIVENSEKGILEGMKKYLSGDLNKMNVDYEKYNKNAIEAFYNLIER